MGLRTYGRTTIWPALLGDNGKVSWVINVGTFVDVWWHDGWWEGIVIHKGSEEQVRVYFPGEKQEAVFCRSDLRHSQEWMGSTWKKINESPNFAASILSDRMREGARATAKTNNVKQPQTVVCNDKRLEHGTVKNISPHVAQDCSPNLHTELASSSYEKANGSPVLDLSKDDLLSWLKWSSSSCKRKRNMFLVQKLQPCGRNRVSSGRIRSSHQDFLIPSTLKIKNDGCKSARCDTDNCKYVSDSLFGSSVVPALTSLVMSR